MMILGPHLVDSEDVDEAECEHHEVDREHRAAGLEGRGSILGGGRAGWAATRAQGAGGFLPGTHSTGARPGRAHPGGSPCPPAPWGCRQAWGPQTCR